MNPMKKTWKVRVLVVDDSAYNRQSIADMLSTGEGVEVVGWASNGEEALKEAMLLKPDIITLDLEMPKMDGFTFLRILMSRQPTPVIVISSYSRKQNVFKALELGAVDFIAKPTRHLSPELHKIRDELLEKVQMVRYLRASSISFKMHDRSSQKAEAATTALEQEEISPDFALVVIGASTGGPPALQTFLQMLPRDLPITYLIAQHMPSNFTNAFAERLNRYTQLEVTEAKNGDVLIPGRVLISPGGHCLKVENTGNKLKCVLVEGNDSMKYVPSIDLLFETAAEALGNRVMAVLLTGMGSDGKEGIGIVKEKGGRTVAESEETAVIYGMPKEAIDSGNVDVALPLDEIADEVVRFIVDLGTGGSE
jgi:two-component system chemotaxis response regulator CheB